MYTIGVTGGIGMGKSTCAGLLAERGVAVIDTDKIARKLTAVGQPALKLIRCEFGDEVIAESGELNRQTLAERVFSSPDNRGRLEAILHPGIREQWQQFLISSRASGAQVAAVIIPLLYETQAEASFDAVLSVHCSFGTQLERLKKRGWSRDHITKRRGAQMTETEKMRRADLVVWTDGELSSHKAQVDLIMADLN